MARYRYFNVFAGYVDRVTLIFDLSDVQVLCMWHSEGVQYFHKICRPHGYHLSFF